MVHLLHRLYGVDAPACRGTRYRQEPNACLLLANYCGPCSLSYGANIFLVDFSVIRGHTVIRPHGTGKAFCFIRDIFLFNSPLDLQAHSADRRSP